MMKWLGCPKCWPDQPQNEFEIGNTMCDTTNYMLIHVLKLIEFLRNHDIFGYHVFGPKQGPRCPQFSSAGQWLFFWAEIREVKQGSPRAPNVTSCPCSENIGSQYSSLTHRWRNTEMDRCGVSIFTRRITWRRSNSFWWSPSFLHSNLMSLPLNIGWVQTP